jgi:peptidoglycan/LPS O-acetylase OafA/YrhL
VLAFTIPWMLAGTVLRPAGALGRALESAPLRWVGRLSYSLYLWQELFFVKRHANLASALTPLQSWPYNVVALLACAAASYYLLERPLTRLGHRLATPATPGRT